MKTEHDDAGRTMPKREDLRAVAEFRDHYHGRIEEMTGSLDALEI